MNRRKFLKAAALAVPAAAVPGLAQKALAAAAVTAYDPTKHLYGMGIEINKCIGCGRCMEACKAENNVPKEPFFFRTWVERYTLKNGHGGLAVEGIKPGELKPPAAGGEHHTLKSFFVPKLCNQCQRPPCVQVCPVGATFSTEDGVVLVDSERCIGCRYCIQACPYGARYLHPVTSTADKCTFCYHRVVKGLLPACVEVCPAQARVFGDFKSKADPLVRFRRMHMLHILKPHLNTEPKVLYADLDGEVR
ncbi:MAG: 4Fe-4S dicluster domain-containing protein [Deltaproteobacteria bacterium]|nr:4Fe-4S dicluster domain-containing protein [Deltaproteobacteria bacterium]